MLVPGTALLRNAQAKRKRFAPLLRPLSMHLACAPAGIVLDYDDTLLASSWLAQNGLRLDGTDPVPAEAARQLDSLAESAAALLRLAMGYGQVIIITNAETGWVELSAKKFMPSLLPLLMKVRILSARSTFESMYAEPSQWKVSRLSSAAGRLLPQPFRPSHFSHVQDVSFPALFRWLPSAKSCPWPLPKPPTTFPRTLLAWATLYTSVLPCRRCVNGV